MEINDCVTAATAKRLRDSGFEQPAPALGQVWWIPTYARGIVSGYYPKILGSLNQAKKFKRMSEDCFYAATSIDILREMKNHWTLQYWSASKEWCCQHIQGKTYFHKNPAEACAMALEETCLLSKPQP